MATTFQLKITGTETDDKVHRDADCGGGKGHRDEIKFKYVDPDTGTTTVADGIYHDPTTTYDPTDWESADTWASSGYHSYWEDVLSDMGISTWTDMDGNVVIQYWAVGGDAGDLFGDAKCPVQRTITALLGGLPDDTGTSTTTTDTDDTGGTGGTVASDLGTSTMYFASLGDATEFNTESGLILNGTFNLKWNNFEGTAEWNDGTKGRYNSIEDGEVPGTITVIKENVYDNTTTAAYNTFYDLNTGQSQTSPTITLIGGSGQKEFSVEYGSVEATAIQDKYKRYDGSWNDAVDGMIDGMVQAAIDGSYQSKAVLNFKKTKVKDFKEETITAFPDQIMVGTTEDPSDEEIMGTDGIMTDAITPTVASTVAGGEMGNY